MDRSMNTSSSSTTTSKIPLLVLAGILRYTQKPLMKLTGAKGPQSILIGTTRWGLPVS